MFANVGDARLFFDVEGTKLVPDGATMREKPILICLHGGPGLDHTTFRPVLSPLASIAQLIYLDQRGHGRSDRSAPKHWTLAQWADDLRVFCEELGIERPIVLGVSFGGYVAMKYAIRHPGHAAKLILISTSARGTGIPVRREHVLRAFERRGGPVAREVLRRAFDERTPEAYEEFARVCGPLYTRAPADPDAVQRTMRNHDLVPYFERAGGEGVVFDLTAELNRVTSPVLILSGEDDPMTPPEEQRAIADALPPWIARIVSFPRAGHGIARDDPEGMIRAIASFIEE